MPVRSPSKCSTKCPGSAAAARRVAGALATPLRGPSQGALGCGRLGLTRTHLQINDHGSKAGSTPHGTRHRGGSPRHGAAAQGSPEHRLGRLPHKHQQRRVGTARFWRWGAPAPPPCFPWVTHQNGSTAKTWNLGRDARAAQGSTARRGEVLNSTSKTARAPACTCSPGARGLG
jgi:hypothetical protein